MSKIFTFNSTHKEQRNHRYDMYKAGQEIQKNSFNSNIFSDSPLKTTPPFIEYTPAEQAFAPIFAPNYVYITKYGIYDSRSSSGLVKDCVEDIRNTGKDGIVIVSTPMNQIFTAYSTFLKQKGFYTADVALPYFELLYIPFNKRSVRPKFYEKAKKGKIEQKYGVTLYYAKPRSMIKEYIQFLKMIAIKKRIPFNAIELKTVEQAQNSPCPSPSYSLFINGRLQLNEVLSEKQLLKLVLKN